MARDDITLYGIANCDTCRKARRWFETAGLQARFVDVRESPLTDATLRRWQRALGDEALLNRRSITWRRIPEADREELSAAGVRALILEHPTVMRRPVAERGSKVVAGFSPAEYESLAAHGGKGP